MMSLEQFDVPNSKELSKTVRVMSKAIRSQLEEVVKDGTIRASLQIVIAILLKPIK